MNLLQAATDSGGFDFGAFFGTGGPLAAIGAILGFVGKLWLDSRKEKREDRLTDRQSESGIVETTAAAIRLVREQMEAMGKDIAILNSRVADRDREIEKLKDRVEVLEAENEQLRRRTQR
jgi:hypothetical protein